MRRVSPAGPTPRIDPAERQRRFDEMVAASYENGKAVNVASAFEIDDVIDPIESRNWITTLLTSPTIGEPAKPRHHFVDVRAG